MHRVTYKDVQELKRRAVGAFSCIWVATKLEPELRVTFEPTLLSGWTQREVTE